MLPRRRSVLWNYFREIEPGKKVKCSYCSHVLSISAGSFGNLSRHLKSKHPTVPLKRKANLIKKNVDITTKTEIDNLSTKKEVKIETELEKISSTDVSGAPPSKKNKCQPEATNYIRVTRSLSSLKWKQIDDQVIKMIVKEYQPLSMVEDKEFKQLVYMLNPGYTLPSKKTLSSSLLPQLYARTEEQVMRKLENISSMCITTDSWTSINNQNFVAITAHFINLECKFDSVLLDCVEFSKAHTSKNLSRQFVEVAKKWKIDNKVTVCITDNSFNIAAAILECQWRHLPCFAHSINLVVQQAIREDKIVGIISKVKTTVEFFKRSPSALAKLHATQKQLGLPDLKLKQDVATRWNSTLDMLSTCLQIKDALISTVTLSESQFPKILQSDWKIVEKLVDVFQIFKLIAEELSAEKTVTRSKVIVFVKSINKHMLTLSKRPLAEMPKELLSVISRIRKEMEKMFKDIEDDELSAQCTILDPRFKKFGFQDEKKFDNAVSNLKKKVSAIIAQNAQSPAIEKSTLSASLVWQDFDSTVLSLSDGASSTAAGIVEVDKYLQEPLLRRDEDPLKWWFERKNIYPNLYDIMLRRLCVLGSSVPCSRIFSKTGEIMSEKRSSLSATKMPQIVFLNYNL